MLFFFCFASADGFVKVNNVINELYSSICKKNCYSNDPKSQAWVFFDKFYQSTLISMHLRNAFAYFQT